MVGKTRRLVTDQFEESPVGLDDGAFLIHDEETFLHGIDERAPEIGFPVAETGHLQIRAHPSQQLHGGKRLGQVVIGPRFQATYRSFLAGPCRQHHHRDRRCLRIGSQTGQQTESVEIRHHDVGQDQVRMVSACQFESHLAIRCFEHPKVR